MSTRMQHEQHGFMDCNTTAEIATAKAIGWTVVEIEEPGPYRDELKAKAAALGLTYPRNITTDKLAELIAAQP